MVAQVPELVLQGRLLGSLKATFVVLWTQELLAAFCRSRPTPNLRFIRHDPKLLFINLKSYIATGILFGDGVLVLVKCELAGLIHFDSLHPKQDRSLPWNGSQFRLFQGPSLYRYGLSSGVDFSIHLIAPLTDLLIHAVQIGKFTPIVEVAVNVPDRGLNLPLGFRVLNPACFRLKLH